MINVMCGKCEKEVSPCHSVRFHLQDNKYSRYYHYGCVTIKLVEGFIEELGPPDDGNDKLRIGNVINKVFLELS